MNLIRNYVKLEPGFYLGDDVLMIARKLLGKLLVTEFDGTTTSGRIIETEAYLGVTDRASHAYGGKRTGRTEVMFGKGGLSYVYLCYGIHHLFNVVTNKEDVPHAVLVRSIEPVDGKEVMMARSGHKSWSHKIGSGPGNVSKALGILTRHSGISLLGDQLYIADDGFKPGKILATPRIGVDYAGEDAFLPYRFVLTDHKGISARSFTSKFNT
jgi:DNA-3-methyladenine glycosylase